MGRDREKACADARELNERLAPLISDRVDRVLGNDRSIAYAVSHFRRVDVPSRHWAPKTVREHEMKLKRIERDIGRRSLSGFGVKETAEFLRDVTGSERNRQIYRLLLIWIFQGCMQEGWIESNPAEATRKGRVERKRERLTLEQFELIRAHAPSWLQNAMDLSLITLLRREDIVNLKFADVRDGCMWVVPSKTEKTTGVRLQIRMTEELSVLVGRCSDDVKSPFIIHRLPDRQPSKGKASPDREHHTQVLPEQLTRAFEVARTKAGIVGEHPPTFHEIRSLGGKRYKQRGWAWETLRDFFGHDSVDMTKHYLDGHEVEWTNLDPSFTPAQ